MQILRCNAFFCDHLLVGCTINGDRRGVDGRLNVGHEFERLCFYFVVLTYENLPRGREIGKKFVTILVRWTDLYNSHVEERIGSFWFCSASSLTESSWSFRVSEGVIPPGNSSCKVKEDGNARVFGRRLLARFGIFNGFRVLCVGGLLLESTKLDSFLRSFWFRPGDFLFWRIFEGVSLSLESLVKIFDKERFKWQQSLTQTLRNFHRSRAPFSKLWQQFSWIPLNNGATRNGTGQHYAIR